MWKSKKVILVTLLVVGILAGIIAGVALAQTSSTSTADQSQTTPESQEATLLAKVAAVYQAKTGVALDTTALKEAFAEARSQMVGEALNTRLQKLVSEGKITQEQADQYKQWWQARPDTPLTRPFAHGFGDGMMRDRGGRGPGPCW